MSDLNNVTKYIENKLSIERHKINLLNIYNRPNPHSSTVEIMLKKRILNNKKFSKYKIKQIEKYYIEKENNLLHKKLTNISWRQNVVFLLRIQ